MTETLTVQSYLLVEDDPLRGVARTTLERARQRDGSVLWKVVRMGYTLNTDGEWEYEPMPSGRDDDYIARNRYASIEDALKAWERAQ